MFALSAGLVVTNLWWQKDLRQDLDRSLQQLGAPTAVHSQRWSVFPLQTCFGIVSRLCGSMYVRGGCIGAKGGAQTCRPWEGRGCHCGPLLVYFIGAALTTQGWAFPRCSDEQSGHLVLTDTNTHAQRRKHTVTDTHMQRRTVHAACSCCQWCQSWFGKTSLLFHSMNTEESSAARVSLKDCLV